MLLEVPFLLKRAIAFPYRLFMTNNWNENKNKKLLSIKLKFSQIESVVFFIWKRNWKKKRKKSMHKKQKINQINKLNEEKKACSRFDNNVFVLFDCAAPKHCNSIVYNMLCLLLQVCTLWLHSILYQTLCTYCIHCTNQSASF